jgi:hypothetical protein
LAVTVGRPSPLVKAALAVASWGWFDDASPQLDILDRLLALL